MELLIDFYEFQFIFIDILKYGVVDYLLVVIFGLVFLFIEKLKFYFIIFIFV